MSESAVYRARVMPRGPTAAFLALAGTGGVALAVALGGVAPIAVTIPAALVAVVIIARRRVWGAEYTVDGGGLCERLTPPGGGPVVERRWGWGDVRGHSLDREAARAAGGRNVLVIQLPTRRIRLPEPVGADREVHARFVDRFVGYATGDVRGQAPGGGVRAEEGAHRQPLTSGEAPQLRRTLAHQPAQRPTPSGPVPFLDSGRGRLAAGLGALVVLAIVLLAMLRGGQDPWGRFTLVLVPGGLWLGWRALRGDEP